MYKKQIVNDDANETSKVYWTSGSLEAIISPIYLLYESYSPNRLKNTTRLRRRRNEGLTLNGSFYEVYINRMQNSAIYIYISTGNYEKEVNQSCNSDINDNYSDINTIYKNVQDGTF